MPKDPEQVAAAKDAIILLIVFAWLLPLFLFVMLRAYYHAPDTFRLPTHSTKVTPHVNARDGTVRDSDGGKGREQRDIPRYRI